MGFEIISVRELTDEEKYYFELVERVEQMPDLPSRRHALLAIGGGALIAAFPGLFVPDQVNAQGVDGLARAIFCGAIQLSAGLYSKNDTVRAKFCLNNQTASRRRKPVYNAIKTSGLGITDQAFTYVSLAPGAATTVEHSGFEARHSGQNDYLAKTLIDRAEKGFRVRGQG